MVTLDRTFEPNLRTTRLYTERYQHYARLWPLLGTYLQHLSAAH
jgi:hypothetical protein